MYQERLQTTWNICSMSLVWTVSDLVSHRPNLLIVNFEQVYVWNLFWLEIFFVLVVYYTVTRIGDHLQISHLTLSEFKWID